jgi:dTMP kinase
MKQSNPGCLIAFDGIDGAGKTTQVALLMSFFTSINLPVIQSKEPTNGPWGRIIRESAAKRRLPLTEELNAFIEDRKQHVRELILPTLEKGQTVILDRYYFSTIAYQGARGNDIPDLIEQMHAIAPEPDAAIILDVPPEMGLYRVSHKRGDIPNTFENIEGLTQSRRIFAQLAADSPNVLKIDATQSISAVRQMILKGLFDGLLRKKFCAKPGGCDDIFNCSYGMTSECHWAKIMQAVSLPFPEPSGSSK